MELGEHPASEISLNGRKILSFNGLAYLDLQFCTILQRILLNLKSTEFFLLLQYIISEKQVILLGQEATQNLNYILFILSMIKPLNWKHTVIPLLGENMIEALHVQDPYIIGLSPESFRKIKKLDLDNKLIIDLNSFKVQANEAVRIDGKKIMYFEEMIKVLKSQE